MPLVNPIGMVTRRRANGNGVDLMRNAPPHPDSIGSFLVGGQDLSPVLPWYMGAPDRMEAEAAALCQFIAEEVCPARTALLLDVHSGFGPLDRIWFPYGTSASSSWISILFTPLLRSAA